MLKPRVSTVPMWERQSYVDASHMTLGRATLDGRPAVIVGFRNDYAHVGVVDGRSIACEYSWECVARVMNDGNGAFYS